MIIQHSVKRNIKNNSDIQLVQNIKEHDVVEYKNELQLDKSEVKKPKVEVKSKAKTKNQVEIINENKVIEVPKKHSLLEEILEEEINLED